MTDIPHNGRPKSARTVNKELRQALNKYAPEIAQKALAGALKGDSTALLAASNLLLAANAQPDK